ncbi:myelin regulatory factor-like protein [Osmerus mordax]|uniref:myelin regulatory factor-like protein n=1 Tax=Osmerus mordax TaxID=8014 RepID=UPI00350F3A63
MEPLEGVRVPVDVLGENEALQQFFDGQDMSGVLESTVVDTSMLEQYLSNDMDPITFILPESPPDSGSEPCSPPQVNWSNEQVNQEVHQHPASSCLFKEQVPAAHPGLPPHLQLKGPSLHSSPHHPYYLSPADSYMQSNTPAPPLIQETLQRRTPTQPQPQPQLQPQPQPQPRSPHLGPENMYTKRKAPQAPGTVCPPDPDYSYLPRTPGQHAGAFPADRKRRRSESFEGLSDHRLYPDPIRTKASYVGSESEGGGGGGEGAFYDSDGANGNVGMCHNQLLTWEHFQPAQWCPLYSTNYHTLPSPGYHVDTDKGFNYSLADEAFVCQKKNHFQVTVHIGMVGDPTYVKTPSGPAPVESFQVKVFGVKREAPDHLVTIEQSQSDRTKKAFLPVRVSLPGDKITKVTLGRLHFSETTANNMRKKGKPNPDQRYFMMVVGLYATVGEQSYLLVALVSEKIIVRASNPGQFETDSEVMWQRGAGPDTVVGHGRVGINTDTPDEALVVCGNAKIMGAVMHPSDRRAKHNIQEVDSTEQLKRIAQMRIVEYDYKPEFATTMGIDHVHETGIIAQEVKELLPTAVKEMGDITFSDGKKIHNFLMVDKEQIFMENVGAVKQLCKLTDNLENRIQELEVWNTRLAKLKNIGSLRSSGTVHSAGKPNKQSSVPTLPKKPSPLKSGREKLSEKYSHCFHHKAFKASIITLVSTMAFCIIAITALYMLTLRDDSLDTLPDMGSNSSEAATTTSLPSTVTPTSPDLNPVEVDFCQILYCEEVYCCPPVSDVTNTTIDEQHSPDDCSLKEKRKAKLSDSLKNSSDWTNTTIQSFVIKENQQVIDSRYCMKGKCGGGNYSFSIPISKFVPVNMRITVQMISTELLVIHLCKSDESASCSALMDYNQMDGYDFINSQGYVHEWPLPVARLYRSSYHFRTAVAGQADCLTDHNYAGALFTDYHFFFHRYCK